MSDYNKNNVLVGPGYMTVVAGEQQYNLGYYVGGVRFKFDREIQRLSRIDVLGSSDAKKFGESLVVSTVLLESSLSNMWLALKTNAVSADYEDVRTYISVGGDPEFESFILYLYGKSPAGNTRKVSLYKVITAEAGEMVLFSKRNVSTIPVKFECLHDTSRSVGDRLFRIDDLDTPFSLFPGLGLS